MIIIQPKGQNTILPRMESGLHLSLMKKYALFLKAGKKKKQQPWRVKVGKICYTD